jgi:hypothetical protein
LQHHLWESGFCFSTRVAKLLANKKPRYKIFLTENQDLLHSEKLRLAKSKEKSVKEKMWQPPQNQHKRPGFECLQLLPPEEKVRSLFANKMCESLRFIVSPWFFWDFFLGGL